MLVQVGEKLVVMIIFLFICFEYVTWAKSFNGTTWHWLFPMRFHRCGASLCYFELVCVGGEKGRERECKWKNLDYTKCSKAVRHTILIYFSLVWCLCEFLWVHFCTKIYLLLLELEPIEDCDNGDNFGRW